MGHAIHRVTKQVVADNAQEADFNPADWFYISRPTGDRQAISDFDSLRTAGVPSKYWTLVDGPPKRITELSRADKDALEESRLDQHKKAKVYAIDRRNDVLIGKGFEYPESSGIWHSMQLHSQVNMIDMLMMSGDPAFPYPMSYASIDDKEFAVLTNAADIAAFYRSQVSRRAWVKMSSTTLKEAVAAATTLAELALVVDNRT